MPEVAFQKPVGDSVPKINDEVAVGEDLDFQRRWWKFENIMWWMIAMLLLINLAGGFGRGPLAHARMANQAMDVRYERIERTGTPAMLQVDFRPEAVTQGKVKLRVSQSLVAELGAQRIIPAPIDTTLGDGELTYTFSSSQKPGSVEFALQPAHPGIFPLSLQVPGSPALTARVSVVP